MLDNIPKELLKELSIQKNPKISGNGWKTLVDRLQSSRSHGAWDGGSEIGRPIDDSVAICDSVGANNF